MKRIVLNQEAVIPLHDVNHARVIVEYGMLLGIVIVTVDEGIPSYNIAWHNGGASSVYRTLDELIVNKPHAKFYQI